MPSSAMLSSPGPAAEAAAPVAQAERALAVRERALRERVQALLDRLERDRARGEPFTAVPGIGRALAQRIQATLGITTLEELADVARDGRLGRVAGFGPQRVRAVAAYLDTALGRAAQRRPRARRERQLRFDFAGPAARPPVDLLLELDQTWRRLDAEHLPCMAPRLEDHAGAPVWRTERDGWSFTLLRAPGRVPDRVLIHYRKHDREGRCTVVTEHQGELDGQRVIRGRERECARHYELHQVSRDVRTWAHALAESA